MLIKPRNSVAPSIYSTCVGAGKSDPLEKRVASTEIEFLTDGGIQEVVMEGTKDVSDAMVGSVTQCLYEAKKPINVPMMKEIMQKTRTKHIMTPQEEADKVLKLKEPEGKEITAQKTPEGVQRVVDIMKRIHGR